ncbi:MAG TPA: STAS domain-containing protein [Leptospiraceae bacterium]|nr:STAS domain-containing protein [Leptospiraceae bacterium]HMY69916.1 STAS domain-containing protein [Leptospiraceae bacterium]HMZ58864.1 STAS domain-containing protein [Leptospiraceae bacterium]HNF13534.1 STAS domain-containing protein [Leptospiraceae bacterium]HNF27601.1 STAS domain-containing protein [Leptospiraceae bacterium]
MFKTVYDDSQKSCTILLDGVISLKSAIQLKDQIAREAEKGYIHVVLDFDNSVHIDSSGIGALFNSQKFLNDKSGSLKIKNLSQDTLSILRIANLDKHLNII